MDTFLPKFHQIARIALSKHSPIRSIQFSSKRYYIRQQCIISIAVKATNGWIITKFRSNSSCSELGQIQNEYINTECQQIELHSLASQEERIVWGSLSLENNGQLVCCQMCQI